MTKYCSHCDPGITNICDFCRYFDDKLRTVEDGYCTKHQKEVAIEERCDDFYCRLAD